MSIEYDSYLINHRSAVLSAYGWMVNNLDMSKHLSDSCLDWLSAFIHEHDQSKYSIEEYHPYDAYFYGNNKSFDCVERFNHAWLHHIHCNPHHWQHWILFEDDPENNIPYKALEMPKEYVFEMICDWWSFSFNFGNLYEIFDWYNDHKEKMVLHKNTRKLVERILQDIKNKLDDMS